MCSYCTGEDVEYPRQEYILLQCFFCISTGHNPDLYRPGSQCSSGSSNTGGNRHVSRHFPVVSSSGNGVTALSSSPPTSHVYPFQPAFPHYHNSVSHAVTGHNPNNSLPAYHSQAASQHNKLYATHPLHPDNTPYMADATTTRGLSYEPTASPDRSQRLQYLYPDAPHLNHGSPLHYLKSQNMTSPEYCLQPSYYGNGGVKHEEQCQEPLDYTHMQQVAPSDGDEAVTPKKAVTYKWMQVKRSAAKIGNLVNILTININRSKLKFSIMHHMKN